MKFTHLHVHSHYSLLDGLPKIDQLIQAAKKNDMDSLALTDHGVMYGAIEFYKKAKAAGIKPIIGEEMYIAPYGYQSKTRQEDKVRRHLTLLAKDYQGYQNLLVLTTKAQLEGFYYKPRIDKELLRQFSKGLIGLSGCLNGEIAHAILQGNVDKALELAHEYNEIFGRNNFYLELQRHPNLPTQETVNKALQEIARKTGIPLVATADLHYLNVDDRHAQEVLMAINTNKEISDESRLSMKECDLSFHSAKKMAELFDDLPEAIENTQRIANQCNLNIELGQLTFPDFPLEKGVDGNTLLQKLCFQGVEKRYGKQTPEVRKRLDYELSVIKKTNFASYFLIVWDIINWAKSNGIVVGPGRGSAAGSIISYVLNITNLDPLKYNLLFERFLNPERISLPDIDMDFADTRRDEVIDYTKRRYGNDHVAQIITFGTLASRAGIRDVGRATGVPYTFCDRLAKMIPFNTDLKESLKEVSEFRNLYDTDSKAKELIDLAIKLEGVARHASTHACGVVITPNPLTHYTPLQYASADDRSVVTQYEMHAIEDLGLLKMDFLGLKNLTIIENALSIIKERKDANISLDTIPEQDDKTFALLQEAHTTGVFQLECLSGDTIISNTTLKKLFEKQHKKVLESVYVDEGKIHKNRIRGIVKSGKKKLYTLIATNGWYIKATKNHSFLTENGWKKLTDIKPGEKVLMKMKAKHLVYNLYIRCGKQIDGQCEGGSDFCYSCSARFYKNPSKEYARKKIQQAQIRFYQNGGKPWNEGETKYTSEILRNTGRKISKALLGRPLEELWGKERADKFKQAMLLKMSGSGNHMFGKSTPHRKTGFRKDIGHYVRSNWEADFARILNLHKLEYQYEPKTFPLIRKNGEVLHYTPDFYVPSNNTFYEIKGWMHELDQEKIMLFEQQYSQYKFVLISATKFAELALCYKSLISWECPRIPLDRNFNFLAIKEILYSGVEETYDIAMESPGNNFVANGFVVHNSEGMKRYLKELKPTSMEDITAMCALYRPGPMELIPSYIKRKHGKEEVTYLHPKLEPILGPTYAIGVYQEQMMQIAQDLAGFSLPEADTLRKAIGKKIVSLLGEQRDKLIQGMLKNGIEKKTAQKIWELFPPFARYGFNKSHSACYALIAYQTAYLKAHYPVEFVSALLNSRQGDIERLAFFIEEARLMGINVLPPDVNESDINFTPVTDGAIRFGLKAIKNVGEPVVRAIIEDRQAHGSYVSIGDFMERITERTLNRKGMEALIKSGAFDTLKDRNVLLENLDFLLKLGRETRMPLRSRQYSLLGGAMRPAIHLHEAPPASLQQKLNWEKELLGLFISGNPLEKYRKLFQEKLLPSSAVDERFLGKDILVGGIVEGIKKIITKKGDPMVFMKIKDFVGTLEVTLFPRALQEVADRLKEGRIVIIQGKVDMRQGSLSIICNKIKILN